MIRSLLIKNFVLVDQTEVEFGPGLNIITGETGAGKSILINALAQLCGERASPDLVRTGAKKAIIEAQVQVSISPEIKHVASQIDLVDELPDLIVRKEIGSNGSSRIFINDSPISLTNLNLLSTLLFDIHGQHQHQRLLHTRYHVFYLDEFGGHQQLISNYKNFYKSYTQEVKRRDKLVSRQAEELRMHDLYSFQWDELDKAELDPQEYEKQKEELEILANVENLHEDSEQISNLLYANEDTVSQNLVKVEGCLLRISRIDKQFTEMLENLKSARITIEEIGRFAEHYANSLEFNSERAEFLRQRLSHIDFLFKKYQQENVQDLIDYKNDLRTRLDESENFDALVQECNKEITKISEDLYKTGFSLSKARKKSAKEFEKSIALSLDELGMTNAAFRVRIEPNSHGAPEFKDKDKILFAQENGFDSVYFEIALNSGESFRPLHKTASGGEISRIMLGLKAVLAEKDQIPVLIFDEIDSGISGKIAQVVGRKMSALARFHQIFCVTHLPQIAAFADSHYKVSKINEQESTTIELEILLHKEREIEMAHLLGGEQISQHALENARHLLVEADSQKK